MRFATRWLPLAAVAATLSVAAQPALAADAACAPPSAQQQGLKTLASVSSTPVRSRRAGRTRGALPRRRRRRRRDAAPRRGGCCRCRGPARRGRRVPKGKPSARPPRPAARPRVEWAEPNYLYRAARTRTTPSSRSSGACTTPARPAARGRRHRRARGLGHHHRQPARRGRRGRHRRRPTPPRPRAQHRGQPGRVRRRPRDQRHRRRRQRLRRRLARLGLRSPTTTTPTTTNGHGTHVAGTIGAAATTASASPASPGRSAHAAAGATTTAGLVARDRRRHLLRRGPRRPRRQRSFGGARHSHGAARRDRGAPETLFVVAAGNDGKDVERDAVLPLRATRPPTSSASRRRTRTTRSRTSRTIGAGPASTSPRPARHPQHRSRRRVPHAQRHLDGDAHVAGAAALGRDSAHPEWTAQQVKDALRRRASTRCPRSRARPCRPAVGSTWRVPWNAGAAATAPIATTDAPTGLVIPRPPPPPRRPRSIPRAPTAARSASSTARRRTSAPRPPHQPVAGAAGAASSELRRSACWPPGTTYTPRAVLATVGGRGRRRRSSASRRRSPTCDVATSARRRRPAVSSARLTGTVTTRRQLVSYRFEYGTSDPLRAQHSSTSPPRRDGRSPDRGRCRRPGLQPGRVYHYRLVVSGPRRRGTRRRPHDRRRPGPPLKVRRATACRLPGCA